MCWQDYLLGCHTKGQLIDFSLTTTPAEVIGSSRHRRVLILNSDAGTAYRLSFGGGANDPYLVINPAIDPVVLTVDDHGDIVQRSLWGSVGSGTLTGSAYIGELDVSGFWRDVNHEHKY